jgi:hypothetical protein
MQKLQDALSIGSGTQNFIFYTMMILLVIVNITCVRYRKKYGSED